MVWRRWRKRERTRKYEGGKRGGREGKGQGSVREKEEEEDKDV